MNTVLVPDEKAANGRFHVVMKDNTNLDDNLLARFRKFDSLMSSIEQFNGQDFCASVTMTIRVRKLWNCFSVSLCLWRVRNRLGHLIRIFASHDQLLISIKNISRFTYRFHSPAIEQQSL